MLQIFPFPKGGGGQNGRKKLPNSINCAAQCISKPDMKLLEGVGRLHHTFLEIC